MSSPKSYISAKHKDYLSILAYVYLKNNQLEKAITVYKALWHLFPESGRMAFSLSYLHLRTHQFESALFYADTYLARRGTSLGYLLKGQALLKLGRNYEAKEAIRQFLN